MDIQIDPAAIAATNAGIQLAAGTGSNLITECAPSSLVRQAQNAQVRDQIEQRARATQTQAPAIDKDTIRKLVAKLYRASGCSCCRDCDKWEEASAELGEALGVPKYDDGSGHDWYSIGEAAT